MKSHYHIQILGLVFCLLLRMSSTLECWSGGSTTATSFTEKTCGDDDYCIKTEDQVGKTDKWCGQLEDYHPVNSCGISQVRKGLQTLQITTCTCNNKDLCNGAAKTSTAFAAVLTAVVFHFGLT